MGTLKVLHQPVPSIRLVCRCTNHLKLLSLREDRHVSFFSPVVLDLRGLSLTALPKGLSCDCNQMMAKAGRHKAFLTRMSGALIGKTLNSRGFPRHLGL